MKKWLFVSIVFGVLLRLILSITTYHQDLGAIVLAGKYIVGDGMWLNFYNMTGKDVSHTIFNYQPLAYLIPSVIYLPFMGIVKSFGELFINNSWLNSQPGNFNFLLLLFKLPMLLADLAILFLLPKFFQKENQKSLSQIIWALNPLAIYVSSIMGQVDIVLALFLLLSYMFIIQRKYFLSATFIALSALIKPIGLILLPVVFLSSIPAAIAGFGVYLLGILPYLGLASYRYYALFADQIGKSTFAGISIASGTLIPWFFITYLFCLYLYWQKRIDLLQVFLGVLLSSLVFTHFHPQWFVWLIPLALIYSLQSSKKILILGLVIMAWLVILFSFDDTLFFRSFLHSQVSLNFIRQNSLFILLTQLSRAALLMFFYSLLNQVDE